MRYFTVKETAEKLFLEKNTIYRYIKRGKLKTEKISENLKISEDEITRYLSDFKKIESGDYFPVSQLEGGAIKKKHFYDGSITTYLLNGQYYAHYEELKRICETEEKNQESSNIFQCHQKDVLVINCGGIKSRQSVSIVIICKKYSSKYSTQCEILFQDKWWRYPGYGILELYMMSVSRGDTITIKTYGILSLDLLNELNQSFENKFRSED